LWGSEGGGSGPGSELSSVLPTGIRMARFIEQHNIRRIVDLSCGAMAWWPTVLSLARNDVSFLGFDVSETVIESNKRRLRSYRNFEFRTENAVSVDIPACDLLVCGETLNHLPISDAENISRRMLSSKCRFAAMSQNAFVDVNLNDSQRKTKYGAAFRYTDWNLSKSPFNLPVLFVEIPDERGRSLAIYHGIHFEDKA
jgi:hypothetical protein